VNLQELIERGDEARAKACLAIQWFRYLRVENQAAHQRSTDTLDAWANSKADAPVARERKLSTHHILRRYRTSAPLASTTSEAYHSVHGGKGGQRSIG
jgi:hypothetical protein